MDWKKILLITGIIIIILAGILLFLKLKAPGQQAYFEEQYSECIGEHSDVYNRVMAEKTGDTKFCKKLKGIARQYCIVIAEKDVSGCNLLDVDDAGKKSCMVTINKDASLCEAEDYRCLARATGDTSQCNKLNESDRIVSCVAMVNLNADYFLNDQAKTECSDNAHSITAFKYKDKSLCENIVDPEIKKHCLDMPV